MNIPTLFDQIDDQADDTRRDPFGRITSWMTSLTQAQHRTDAGLQQIPMNLTIRPDRLTRRTDPETSREAAEKASRRGPNQRRKVWEALIKLGEATDYELSIETGILRSSAAKRRQELVDLGHVIETPRRRNTDTGTAAIVWRCSPGSSYS